ncbi:MAG TPA: 16S rRNA (guanine(527)-N(7))-methyltransferase RsmG [Candidatus Solibacter sp.]|nr:16S rRNA (guanine(527)-N(7))-methyltransferase RsmG [Candidatus Solibacter sp.]
MARLRAAALPGRLTRPSRAELDARLHQYLDLLLARNTSMNLTAVRDASAAWDKLILGSLAVLDAHRFTGSERVADVGSGGGLPGIPLKLAVPGLSLCLVESDQRKAEFLRDTVIALDLTDVEVQAKRAEEIGRDERHREAYDVVVTRAAAKAPVAAEYCLPLVRPGGLMLALAQYKDWDLARRAIGQLGGRLDGERSGVIVVSKLRHTPEQFPRRVGVPGKRPL